MILYHKLNTALSLSSSCTAILHACYPTHHHPPHQHTNLNQHQRHELHVSRFQSLHQPLSFSLCGTFSWYPWCSCAYAFFCTCPSQDLLRLHEQNVCARRKSGNCTRGKFRILLWTKKSWMVCLIQVGWVEMLRMMGVAWLIPLIYFREWGRRRDHGHSWWGEHSKASGVRTRDLSQGRRGASPW